MDIEGNPQAQELKLSVHTASALLWERIQRALAEAQTDYALRITAVAAADAAADDDGTPLCAHVVDCALDDEAIEKLLLSARQQQGAPVVLVGAGIGEEAAAAWMLRGAANFVHTDNLTRLPRVLMNAVSCARPNESSDPEARYKALVEFFTNVSHELRTPLSLILLQMEQMRVNIDNPRKLLRTIDAVTMNSYRLTRLVSNLLDLTKMEGGFMTLNLKQRDIVSELRAICDSVTDYATARNLEMRFVSDVTCRVIDVDREKLDRIVLNLLSNAIKHTGAGGTITVGLQSLRDIVRIRVTDTGEGIPEDQLETIFDRFAQASNPRFASGEGTGIGLALVRSLAELHRGRVWVQSKPGCGSTFFVELPEEIADVKKNTLNTESFELKRKVDMELSNL